MDPSDCNSKQFPMERDVGAGENPFLSFDLLCEVLRRVDALTLAKARCVNWQFRRVCSEEAFWKRLCNSQWPATKQPAAEALIIQTGGFRQFCARCLPCVSGKGSPSGAELATPPSRTKLHRISSKVEDESFGEPLPSHFVSIIDVMYNGHSMLSRIIPGFPGIEEFEWFESCPFQFDLLEVPCEFEGVWKDEEGVTSITIGTNTESVPYAEARKMGSLWKALNANVTASWILVNKMTGQMANLASCKPVGGRRHWPCADEFLLHFGTVIPGLPSDAIHCNVALKARYSTTDHTTSLRITELGMKLENCDGARLYGMESVALLGRALSCNRTISHSTVMESYKEFHVQQLARKEVKIQRENRQEMIAAFVSGIGAFVCLCYVLL